DRVEQGSGTAGRLIALLDSLSERLLAAGLVVGEPLTVGGVAAAMRRGYDEDPPGGPVLWPWPTGVSAHWSTLRTDGVVHATYWVSEWPRGEVGPGFLLPLLIGSGHRRTVAVTMAPVGPENAVRRAERERTSGAADAELRRRHGFAMTARARLEQDLRQQRESELADGHAGFAYSGYVTVTEPDEAALDRACTEVEQAAALAQLDLRRLYGTQEAAWCCTLPTGRGCR
ncbi:MAG: SCO6880 family protein, partial [Acidimicrobiales bacterium]